MHLAMKLIDHRLLFDAVIYLSVLQKTGPPEIRFQLI